MHEVSRNVLIGPWPSSLLEEALRLRYPIGYVQVLKPTGVDTHFDLLEPLPRKSFDNIRPLELCFWIVVISTYILKSISLHVR